MVLFKFSEDHGSYEKGEEVEMFKSTAKALAKHKIGKIVKDEEPKKEEPKGEAGTISSNQE